MSEAFAIPCVGAIIEKNIDGENYILLQTRYKRDGGDTNNKLEIPAGKIREYENIFDALRREVYEETGLIVTDIVGENSTRQSYSKNVKVASFDPFCISQNLSGAYSIILLTFICKAEGDLLESTDETKNINWVKVSKVRMLLETEPDAFFFMHLNALNNYLSK